MFDEVTKVSSKVSSSPNHFNRKSVKRIERKNQQKGMKKKQKRPKQEREYRKTNAKETEATSSIHRRIRNVSIARNDSALFAFSGFESKKRAKSLIKIYNIYFLQNPLKI